MSTIAQYLTHLETHNLIKLAQTQPELEFMFRHALVQDVAYESLLFADRKRLHQTVAETIERLYADNLDEQAATLAHHYTQAGDDKKAALYLIQAGDHARQMTAFVEAVQFYQTALEYLPASDQAIGAETLDKLGVSQEMIARMHKAIESFVASKHLFEIVGNQKKVAMLERKIGAAYAQVGDKEKALHHAHKALTILEQGQQSIELAWALSSISQLHMLFGEFKQAITIGEQALLLAQHLNAEEVTVHALNNVGTSYFLSGDTKQGLDMLQDSLSRALRLGLPQATLRAYYNLGTALAVIGHYKEAQRVLKNLQVQAMAVHNMGYFGASSVFLTRLEWLLGEWHVALTRHHHEFYRFYNPQAPNLKLGIWTSSLLGRIYNDLGQTKAARQELELTLSNARRADEAQTTLPHLAQLVRVYTTLGLTVEAEALVQEFLNWFQRDVSLLADIEGVPSLLIICQWLSSHPKQKRQDDVYACLDQLELAHKQFNTLETEAHLNEGRGNIALAEMKHAEAIEQFQQAATCWKDVGRPYDQLRALKGWGQALKQTSATDKIPDVFSQAFDLVEMLAAQLEDVEMKNSFLNSMLVQEIKNGLK